jgi:GTP-binding protein HflX
VAAADGAERLRGAEEPRVEETLRLGFDQGRQRAWLFDHQVVRSEAPTEAGYELGVRWTGRQRSQYLALR